MTRYPSRAGHVILPRGEGWHVPDFMPEGAEPVTIAAAKEIIDRAVESGQAPLEPSSVTWDTTLTAQGSHGHVVVHCAQAAPPAGLSRGDRVRVTIRRIERCGRLSIGSIPAPCPRSPSMWARTATRLTWI